MLLVLAEREHGSAEMCDIFKSMHPLSESAGRGARGRGENGCVGDGARARRNNEIE